MGQTLSNPLNTFTRESDRSYSESSTSLSPNSNYDQPLGPYDRAKAAIIGAFVADAISVSSTYTRRDDDNDNDDDKVIRNFEEQEGIIISSISKINISKDASVGIQSTYGDEAFPFLQYISTRYIRINTNCSA